MKIGYVLKYFPKLSETFVLHEMVAAEEAGTEVTVFALGASSGDCAAPALGRLGARVHYLGAVGDDALVSALAGDAGWLRTRLRPHLPALLGELQQEKGALTTLRRVAELVAHVRQLGIEHLHAHFAGPAADIARLAARLAGIPYSVTCHAKDIYHDSVTPAAFRRRVSGARAVITVCEANRRHILTHLAPELAPRLHVVYNGVDLDAFRPVDHTSTVSPSRVLGVGRLVAKKGFSVLVEALARLGRDEGRAVEGLILGEGREREDLEHKARALGAPVRLPGSARHDQVRAALAESSVLALPCVVDVDGNRDALPTVLLEAMAAGVPVVSTPVTGVSEIIEDGVSGILVPEGDPEALAVALRRILDDPHHAESLARGGRARAEERFDLRRNVRHLMQVLAAEPAAEAVA